MMKRSSSWRSFHFDIISRIISALPLEECFRNTAKIRRENTITKISSTGLCYLFCILYNISIFCKKNNMFNHNAFSLLYGYGEFWNKNNGILFLILQYKSLIKYFVLVYIRIMNILTPIYKSSFRNMGKYGALYFKELQFTHFYDLNQEWRLYITPLIWHDDFISPWRVSIPQHNDFPFREI